MLECDEACQRQALASAEIGGKTARCRIRRWSRYPENVQKYRSCPVCNVAR